MTDNVTNLLLAQLLMKPSRNRTSKEIGEPRQLAQRPAYPAVPYWMPPDPTEDFISRWPSDDEFGSRLPDWFIQEQIRNLTSVRPPEPPPLDLELDHRRPNGSLRRRFEEFDAEYPRRPLRRR